MQIGKAEEREKMSRLNEDSFEMEVDNGGTVIEHVVENYQDGLEGEGLQIVPMESLNDIDIPDSFRIVEVSGSNDLEEFNYRTNDDSKRSQMGEELIASQVLRDNISKIMEIEDVSMKRLDHMLQVEEDDNFDRFEIVDTENSTQFEPKSAQPKLNKFNSNAEANFNPFSGSKQDSYSQMFEHNISQVLRIKPALMAESGSIG
mmetsp:Transcript_18036/g.30737  ORF Transcript_18036/g.30737 Transcript_18036/m.30737 type:complete len:203 (+) Transcript_18036:152-760(+)